ncbi:MAG TPA: hypothetical protein VMG82_37675 [Candidatus Sulfotelmatobacter sp.]|nr:hypothetical protein [Candidatus Sulfotelmatobacter sp.]
MRIMKRMRGNPDWGRLKSIPTLPTEFEIEVARLGLRKSEYVASAALRLWCHRHRNRLYVPEWLLKEWGMQVEVSVGAA